MLAGGLDATYRQALAGPHGEYVLVEVLDGNGNVLPIPDDSIGEDGGLEFIGGNVSATLASRVTRQLDLTVNESLYPSKPTDLLAPYGNRLRVWRGIKFATGDVYRWVIFTGRIQNDVNASDGEVSITVMDRADEVVRAEFLFPENSSVGNTVNAEFVRLVSDGVPSATFGTSDTFAQTVPSLTWQSDRAGAIDELGTTVGAYWYALANGDYVIRRYPFAVAAPSVVTLNDGEGGTVIGVPTRDSSGIFNSVTATGERADGTSPVFALAQDMNPASITYVLGPFGRQHTTLSLQTPQTQGSAQSAANAFLRTSLALTETWTWTQPVDAALELGDVVTLNARDESGIIQVVSGFVIPLEVDGLMSVTGRAQVTGVLE
jgi:Domain of unknown function (DUF5047)/Putative phage tail protein